MSLISAGLGTIPAIVAIAAVLGRVVALLVREVRLAMVAWLALRGTQPGERPDILRALVALPHQAKPRIKIPKAGLVSDRAER